jgi:sugar lactone lactonase YvrE
MELIKRVEKSVKLVAQNIGSDGMILDENGTLYFADLKQQICIENKMVHYTLVEKN